MDDQIHPIAVPRSEPFRLRVIVRRLESVYSWGGVFCDYTVRLQTTRAEGEDGTSYDEQVVATFDDIGGGGSGTWSTELVFTTDLARGEDEFFDEDFPAGITVTVEPTAYVIVEFSAVDYGGPVAASQLRTLEVHVFPDSHTPVSYGFGASAANWSQMYPDGTHRDLKDQCGEYLIPAPDPPYVNTGPVYGTVSMAYRLQSGGDVLPHSTNFARRRMEENTRLVSDSCATMMQEAMLSDSPDAIYARRFLFGKCDKYTPGSFTAPGDSLETGFGMAYGAHPDAAARQGSSSPPQSSWYNDHDPGVSWHDTFGYERNCMINLLKGLEVLAASTGSAGCEVVVDQDLMFEVTRGLDGRPVYQKLEEHLINIAYSVSVNDTVPYATFDMSRDGSGSIMVEPLSSVINKCRQ